MVKDGFGDNGETAWAVRIGGGNYFRGWGKGGKMITGFGVAKAKLFSLRQRSAARAVVKRILKRRAYRDVYVHIVRVQAKTATNEDFMQHWRSL